MTLKNPKTCPRCGGIKTAEEANRRHCSPCVLKRIVRFAKYYIRLLSR